MSDGCNDTWTSLIIVDNGDNHEKQSKKIALAGECCRDFDESFDDN